MTTSLERRAHGEWEAVRLLQEGLAAAGLEQGELEKLPGSDGRKVVIGRRIWEKTTMSMRWISDQLVMKSAANASQAPRRKEVKVKTLPKELREWLILSRYDS
jgi:hypothetical protein